MFNVKSETYHVLGRMLNRLPKDIALSRVYDYYDRECLLKISEYVNNILDTGIIQWCEENEALTETRIEFASYTFYREYFKLYLMLSDRDKKHFNKLTEDIFTINSFEHPYAKFTEYGLKVANNITIESIKILACTVAKEFETYREKQNKKLIKNKT